MATTTVRQVVSTTTHNNVVTATVQEQVRVTTTGARGPQGPQAPKTVTVLEPFAGDQYTVFQTPHGLTIASIQVALRGSASPSITYKIERGPNITSAGNTVVASTTFSAVGTISNAVLVDGTLEAGDFLWIDITATSGNVEEFYLTINFG